MKEKGSAKLSGKLLKKGLRKDDFPGETHESNSMQICLG